MVGGTQFALPSLTRKGDLGGRSHTQAARRPPRKQPAVPCSASPLALALPHVLRHASRLREPPSPCRPSSRASTASGHAPRAATSNQTFGTAPLTLCHLLALAGQHPGHHRSLRVQTNPRRAGPFSAPIVLQPPPGPRFPAETGSLFCAGPTRTRLFCKLPRNSRLRMPRSTSAFTLAFFPMKVIS